MHETILSWRAIQTHCSPRAIAHPAPGHPFKCQRASVPRTACGELPRQQTPWDHLRCPLPIRAMALNIWNLSPHQLRKLILNRQQAQHSVWLLGVTRTHTEPSLGTLEGSTSRVIVEKKVWCVCPCVCVCTHARVYKCVHREREGNGVATHTSAL